MNEMRTMERPIQKKAVADENAALKVCTMPALARQLEGPSGSDRAGALGELTEPSCSSDNLRSAAGHRRASAMPVGRLLEPMPDLQQRHFIEVPSDQLKAEGQA